MRKIHFIFATVLLFSSCLTPKQYQSVAVSMDYSVYAKAGLFITESNTLSKEYEPIASIRGMVKTGNKILYPAKYNKKGDMVRRAKYGKLIHATQEDALKALVIKAKQLGANGLINLKFKTHYPIDKEPIYEETVFASAMAIKILPITELCCWS